MDDSSLQIQTYVAGTDFIYEWSGIVQFLHNKGKNHPYHGSNFHSINNPDQARPLPFLPLTQAFSITTADPSMTPPDTS